MSSSLGDKLAQLSLDIDDKAKTIEILRNLIKEQSDRHSSEAERHNKEKRDYFEKCTREYKENETELHTATTLLKKKRDLIENEIRTLTEEKEEAENQKKNSIESLKRGIANSKDSEHKAFLRDQSERENQWISAKKNEINQLTLKGIQPQIERLVRKHREICEEIKFKTISTKQKLEIQSELDLSERIELFRSNEQRSSICIKRRNDFAHLMAKEQSDHAANLMKLKEKLIQEVDTKRKAQSMEIETLKRDHDAELAKSKAPKSMQNLIALLSNEKDAKQQNLESKLDRVGKNKTTLQTTWEQEWMEASRLRSDGINRQKKKELLEWRELRVRDLIKTSIVKQSSSPNEQNKKKILNEQPGNAIHKNNLDLMKDKLNMTQISIQELEMKLSAAVVSKTQIMGEISNLESLETVIDGELENVDKIKETQSAQNSNKFDMVSDRINRSMAQIHLRHEDIENQISCMETKHNQESCLHDERLYKIDMEHEQNLDELERAAFEKVCEIDKKLAKIKNMLGEKESYLVEVENLLSKYKKKNKQMHI